MKLSKKVLKEKGLYTAIANKKPRKVRNNRGEYIDHSKEVGTNKYSNLVQKGKILDEPIHDQYNPIKIVEADLAKLERNKMMNETSFGADGIVNAGSPKKSSNKKQEQIDMSTSLKKISNADLAHEATEIAVELKSINSSLREVKVSDLASDILITDGRESLKPLIYAGQSDEDY